MVQFLFIGILRCSEVIVLFKLFEFFFQRSYKLSLLLELFLFCYFIVLYLYFFISLLLLLHCPFITEILSFFRAASEILLQDSFS